MAMLEYLTGDILQSPSPTLVNPVNCVGVMGAGLALQFKNRYPRNFEAYRQCCKRGELQPGKMFIYEEADGKTIINFPTKWHWRDGSKPGDILVGLLTLAQVVKERGCESIAIPRLGCGLGGLSWDDEIQPMLSRSPLVALENLKVMVYSNPDK